MTASILVAIGIVMIYSSSSIYALDKMGDSAYFLKRHLVYVFAGLALGVEVEARSSLGRLDNRSNPG